MVSIVLLTNGVPNETAQEFVTQFNVSTIATSGFNKLKRHHINGDGRPFKECTEDFNVLVFEGIYITRSWHKLLLAVVRAFFSFRS